MALSADKFKVGSRAIAAKQYEVYIDLHNGKGKQFLCNTEANENFNTSDESITTLCGEGNIEHELTTIDYSFHIDTVLKKGDLTDDLYDIADDINALSDATFYLNNTLMDVQKSFEAVIKITTIGASSDALVKVVGDVMQRDGKINKVSPIPVDPTATIGDIENITDTTADINYTYNANGGDTSLSTLEVYAGTDIVTPITVVSPLVDGTWTESLTGLTAETPYYVAIKQDGVILASKVFATIASV